MGIKEKEEFPEPKLIFLKQIFKKEKKKSFLACGFMKSKAMDGIDLQCQTQIKR